MNPLEKKNKVDISVCVITADKMSPDSDASLTMNLVSDSGRTTSLPHVWETAQQERSSRPEAQGRSTGVRSGPRINNLIHYRAKNASTLIVETMHSPRRAKPTTVA